MGSMWNCVQSFPAKLQRVRIVFTKEMHTNKNTWYVWYNWQKYEIYPVGFRTPQKAYAYALKEYKKWVGKQMKICQEAKGYLKEMENDNQE